MLLAGNTSRGSVRPRASVIGWDHDADDLLLLSGRLFLLPSVRLVVRVLPGRLFFFFFSSRRRHTRSKRDWSSDVYSSDLRSWAYRGRELSRATTLLASTVHPRR